MGPLAAAFVSPGLNLRQKNKFLSITIQEERDKKRLWKIFMNIKFNPYPSNRPSGIPWLGEVPEHWDVLALKRIVQIPITDGPHETPELQDSGVPFVSAEAIQNGKIQFGSIRGFISTEANKIFSRKYSPKRGDIYLVKSGATTGRIAMVETDELFNIWSPLAAIRSNPDSVLPEFLFLALQSDYFQRQIQLFWNYGTQQNIGMGVIGNLTIYLPKLEEQQTIVAFLEDTTTKLDELIAQKQRLIELLKEKRQALITQAVTKGLNPNVKMKDSGVPWLGQIPEHWDVLALKRVVSIPITDGPHETPELQDSGVPFVSAEAIQNGKIKFDSIRGFISEEANEIFSRKYSPMKGDIYMVKSGATTGRVAMVETNELFNIWSPLAAIRCNSDLVLAEFMLLALQSDYFQRQIQLFWNYGTQQNIGMGVIGNLRLILPPLKEQKEAITKVVESNNKIVDLEAQVEGSIQGLQNYRQSVISAAVTGKIDLRDWKAS